MKLETLSAIELGKLVNTKEVSPVEVIEYFLDRVNNYNTFVNAFTYTNYEDAIYEAKILESRIIKGESVGPFAGVPVGLKDFLDSKKRWTNSHGGVLALCREDVQDSEFYKTVRSLGAIAIGKTNAPAFGFSGVCTNKMYGPTRNPFDYTRSSGGSSGGSAAAVASGFVPVAEGGDAGGSIRIPASWCNLFGFKPSVGAVPSVCRPDGWAATHPFCFNGALTHTVDDSALIFNSMARYNPRDPISLPINWDIKLASIKHSCIKDLKIGISYDFDLTNIHTSEFQAIKSKVNEVGKILSDCGAKVEEISSFNFHHSFEEILHCWAWSISIDTALDIQKWKNEGLDLIKDYKDQLPEEFVYYNEVASSVTIQDFRKFNEIRTDILDNFEDKFFKYDIILSPVTTCTPLKINESGNSSYKHPDIKNQNLNILSFAETFLLNFVGYPAASVPAGFIDGLPIGVQVIGKKFRDKDVFRVSKHLEEALPWRYSTVSNLF